MAGQVLFNAAIVAMAVLVHYEFLYRLSRALPKLPVQPHARIMFGVFGALLAHVIEVCLFALGFYYMHHQGWGQLQGNYDGSLTDSIYFSFTTFSTLGVGDIEPLGALRHLAGIESLIGLVLITWSASFLFYEMQRYWGR